MRHEQRIVAIVIAAGLVPAAVAVPLAWSAMDAKGAATVTLAIGVAIGVLAALAHGRVVRPMQTIANLAASLREGLRGAGKA